MSALPVISSPAQCHSGCRNPPVRFGCFTRKSDGRRIQRYRCLDCGVSFSDATGDFCFRQKKRHLNPLIFEQLSSGVSQRRLALLLRTNRKTVVRKFLFLGRIAIGLLPLLNHYEEKVTALEFDDLETFEHSKCKPLSVTLAVVEGSRRLLGFRVSQMPAKGKLSKISRKKYGPRQDERAQARESLFRELKPFISPECVIKSDMNPHYPPDVREHFPGHRHKTTKGRRGCVVGQGELKRGGLDPIFSLNHTCAMLRANINRLFRRTWCTTKLKERLGYHIAIYALYHNHVLI